MRFYIHNTHPIQMIVHITYFTTISFLLDFSLKHNLIIEFKTKSFRIFRSKILKLHHAVLLIYLSFFRRSTFCKNHSDRKGHQPPDGLQHKFPLSSQFYMNSLWLNSVFSFTYISVEKTAYSPVPLEGMKLLWLYPYNYLESHEKLV